MKLAITLSSVLLLVRDKAFMFPAEAPETDSLCELHAFACIRAIKCTQDAANHSYLLRRQDRVCALCMETQQFVATAIQHSNHVP